MRLGLDTRLTYYTRGGIARYIRRLAERLPGLAPEAEHVHFYRRGHAELFSRAARRVDCWTPAHHGLEGWALGAEVAPWRLDLLHSPDFIPPRWGARRLVITVHDLTFLIYPQFLTADSRRYYNGQIERAVRQAALIAADSEATRQDVLERLKAPAEKVQTIPLGLDPAFRPQPDETVQAVLARHGLPRGYVLCVGTFEPRKNVPGLLRAYARLRPDAPPLALVGNRGWLFDDVHALAGQLGLTGRVRFIQDAPEADLPALYTGAGAFALLSHYEGFGFPVLEALGCGTPCVIAGRASLPEIAGGAALAVDPDDPEAAAAALERALNDTALRADLRRRGLARAAEFTWERTAAQTLALYRRALEDEIPNSKSQIPKA